MAKQLQFEDPVTVDRGEAEPAFAVDIDGYTGPLDLLLDLARRQKVDLARLSILALAEQYLAFVEEARRFRLELAADYLVMAAWLAYLKSRLLLPTPPRATDEPSAEEMASQLAERLQKLDAIRAASRRLMERPQLGRDFFARGMPEAVVVTRTPDWDVSLYDLLSAYAAERQKQALARVRFARRPVWSLTQAREALQRLAGTALDWTVLDHYLRRYVVEPGQWATVRASAFSAALELVREGTLQIQQEKPFAPLWIKARDRGVA